MLRDACGSLWGTLVFSLALIAPGYCFGRLTNFLGFRSRGLREQLAWSVTLSFGAGTLPLVAVVWLGGAWAGAAVLLALGITAAWMFVRDRAWAGRPLRGALPLAALAAFATVIMVGSLTDVGIHQRLWMSVTAYDNSLRTAFVNAVLRTGVPPVNPAYWPGHDAPMRYYYFWYVTCAAIARVAHISARQALAAGTVWPFFGLAAMLALFGRYLLGWRGPELRKRWWTALVLFCVTGLDVLVVLFVWLTDHFVAGDLEWWSIDQVTSWLDTFLWVPHHAAGLVCCLLCVLLLWIASGEENKRTRLIMAAIAGLSFASGFGLSIYVAAATVLVLAMWLLWRLFHHDRSRVFSSVAVASLVAAIVLTPYLVQLLQHQPGPSTSAGHVLTFGVRRILSPVILAGFPGLQSLQPVHPVLARELAALLLLLPCYGVELGFFGIVLLAGQQKRRKVPGESALLFFTWAGFVSASFLRSQVIATNDYSIRATLLSQFMLLLLAVLVLERTASWSKKALLGLAIIGVAGTVYQLVLLKLYLPMQQKHGDPNVVGLAEYNYALRDADAALQGHIPQAARVQHNVHVPVYFSSAQLFNTSWQVIADTEKCNTSFGGEATPCMDIQASIARIFPQPGTPAPSAQQTSALCGRIGADYLVATRWDAAWSAKDSWVWTLPLVVERPSVRVVSCSNTS